ncbi:MULTISPECIES: hypothetical protein [Raoultella]|uniref:hypothetical protein n=1 Tax=Raoultella TaxID=160674 RepID=UPI00216A8C4F|nr:MULTISPECIES: hypothetical protein [Raoultella]MCS4271079.1 hypothetical protein [Raoultella sp. BIGb0132]MCS4288612.1 hypothetical protein [Raoultella terrigena]
MTIVGIKAIDFTKKSRLELLVFSLDIITFLSFKMAAFVGYKPSNIESGTDTIQPPHCGTCRFDSIKSYKKIAVGEVIIYRVIVWILVDSQNPSPKRENIPGI